MSDEGFYRVGRSWGRTLVQQQNPEPVSGADVLLGHARTLEAARAAVAALEDGASNPDCRRWWSAGGLIYPGPGASLVSDWIIAVDDPELAQRIVAAVRGEAA